MLDIKRIVLLALAALLIKRSRVIHNIFASYRASKLKLVTVVSKSSKFETVIEAFKQNFIEGRERGAQLALTVDGQLVLDIKAGRDENTVFEDLTMVFSCSKVVESLCVAILVDKGVLDYDQPVAKYWPEYGTYFSPRTTVAQLMKHEAGLAQIYKPLTSKEATEIFNDVKKLEQYLYSTMKVDEDVGRGERKARYHAYSRGFFVDVLITRADGRRPRDFIRDEIVAKVPGVEFFLGIPAELQSRMAVTEPSHHVLETAVELLMHKFGIVKAFYHPGSNAAQEEIDAHERDFLQDSEVKLTLNMLDRNSAHFKALILVNDLPFGTHHLANVPDFRALPLMSVTGATNARSMALLGAELSIGGGRLLSSAGLQKALHHTGPVFDEMIMKEVTYVNCGWTVDRLGPDWIGWAGAGGSVFVFSTKYKASFGYIPTRLEGRIHKPNALRILSEFKNALIAMKSA